MGDKKLWRTAPVQPSEPQKKGQPSQQREMLDRAWAILEPAWVIWVPVTGPYSLENSWWKLANLMPEL